MSRVNVNFPAPTSPQAGSTMTAQEFRSKIDSLCGIHTYWKHPRSGGAAISDPMLGGTPYVTVEDLGSLEVDWQFVEYHRSNTSIFSHFHATLDGETTKVDVSLWGGLTRAPNGFTSWIHTEGTRPTEQQTLDGTDNEVESGTEVDWIQTAMMLLPDSGGYDAWETKTSSLMDNWSLATAASWGNYKDIASGWTPNQILAPNATNNDATNSTWAFYPVVMGAWLGASTDALHLSQVASITIREETEEGRIATLHVDAESPAKAHLGYSLHSFTGTDNGRAYHWAKAGGYVAPRPSIPPEEE